MILVGDWASNRDGELLEAVVYSDMIATTGLLNMNNPDFDAEALTANLGAAGLPDLSGVSVSISGVGVVSGPNQPPTDFVDAARLVATRLCEATDAACSVTTV
jgi:hypothetical protein